MVSSQRPPDQQEQCTKADDPEPSKWIPPAISKVTEATDDEETSEKHADGLSCGDQNPPDD